MDEANIGRHIQVLSATIALCAALDGTVVVVHPGRVPVSATPDMERLLAVERAAVLSVAPQARDSGVKIGLENLNPDTAIITGQLTSYALDPRRLAAQVAAIGHPAVCGVIDVGHGYLSSRFVGFDLAETLASLAPLANHLHLQDGFGQPVTVVGANKPEQLAYGQGDMHLPLGWGDLDLDTLLPGLPVRPDTRMVVELAPRYMRHIGDSIARARAIAETMNSAAEA
jgi:sugar phosphate isomerase/epimerase